MESEDGATEIRRRRCRRAARMCATLASVIGLTTLIGWQIDLPVLKSVVPGLVAMNPATAVCFVLSAVALQSTAHGSPAWLRAAGVVAAALVTVSGLLCVGGYLLGRPAGIDQLLFTKQLGAGLVPNRMAPNTAFDFLALGSALLLMRFDLKRTTRWWQALIGCVVLTAFVALVGYAYSVTSLIAYASFIPMAMHTAICFVLLASAAFLSFPEAGFMERATSSTPGGRLVWRLVPAFAILPPLLGWLRLQGELVGLYNNAFGTAMMTGAIVVMGVSLSWLNAASLDRTDEVRREAEKITKALAYYDPLTGLPNRTLFSDRLSHALARSERYGGMVALMFLDLDGFKKVNDTRGHAAGDALLKSVARRLSGCVRPTDTVSRVAGDEFTIVLTDLRDHSTVEVVANRLLEVLSAPHDVLGQPTMISASIGATVAPMHGLDADALLQNADLAMYSAKRAGKNRFAMHGALDAATPA